MQLRKPEEYRPDPGRHLSPQEIEQVAEKITHISKIKSRTCKREGTNDRWRLGRR
jgi:hypothetical protein